MKKIILLVLFSSSLFSQISNKKIENWISKNNELDGSIVSIAVKRIDKDKKIISGDPEKIKKIYDTWVFSRDTISTNPNWQLFDILT